MPRRDEHSHIKSNKQENDSYKQIINSVHRIEGIVGIFDILAQDT
jgi:hypothetical protein